jgi:hypothetical protein
MSLKFEKNITKPMSIILILIIVLIVLNFIWGSKSQEIADKTINDTIRKVYDTKDIKTIIKHVKTIETDLNLLALSIKNTKRIRITINLFALIAILVILYLLINNYQSKVNKIVLFVDIS